MHINTLDEEEVRMERIISNETEKLMQVLGFDRKTCEDLIYTFIEQGKDGFIEMNGYLEMNEYDKVLGKLHQLKGAAGAIRMEKIRQKFQQAEELIKANEYVTAKKFIDDLQNESIFKV